MGIKEEVLEALDSDAGQKLIEGALVNALQSDDGQEALRNAIEGVLLETLQSNDGQKALRNTVQAELEEGFASHAPTLTGVAKKQVGPNQQWLFDTVEKIRKKVNAA
jgi:hypothetical protein